MKSCQWTRPQTFVTLQKYLSSDDTVVTKFLDKCFSTSKIHQYFRTHSCEYGWYWWLSCTRSSPHYSLMIILIFITSFVIVSSSLTLLTQFTHLLLKNMETDFLWWLRNRMNEGLHPIFGVFFFSEKKKVNRDMLLVRTTADLDFFFVLLEIKTDRGSSQKST